MIMHVLPRLTACSIERLVVLHHESLRQGGGLSGPRPWVGVPGGQGQEEGSLWEIPVGMEVAEALGLSVRVSEAQG